MSAGELAGKIQFTSWTVYWVPLTRVKMVWSEVKFLCGVMYSRLILFSSLVMLMGTDDVSIKNKKSQWPITTVHCSGSTYDVTHDVTLDGHGGC